LRVLLVEDDEDDFILAKGHFADMQRTRVQLDWMRNFAAGLEAMTRNQHDICLVDYRLGAQNGIELLRAALAAGCQAPVILLTGQGEHEIDLEAMKAGAADYLVKGRIETATLERTIRYAIERRRAAERAVAEQARLAAFGEDVGLALTRRDSLEAILHRCASAMVHSLNASLARIWTFEPEDQSIRLVASAGPLDEPGALEGRTTHILLDPAEVANGKPILIANVASDPRTKDPDWARRHGVVSFAAYPLLIDERLVGLMSVFARTPLAQVTIQEMASVAHGIALCIERKRSAEALDASEVRYQSVVENIKEVIFQTDAGGRWSFLNRAWTDITGFKIKQSLGVPMLDYIHPEDRARHHEVIQEVMARRKSFCRDETRYLAADGTFRWMEVYAQPVLSAHDDVFGISGTLSDITDRKRAEAEIQKLAAFPRYNPEPVMELAADGTLTYLNHAAREKAQQLDAGDPEAILPPNAAAIARECLRQGTRTLSQEIKINGRTLLWSFFPIIASQVVHCYGTDITERVNLEAQLLHSQKLESIGQLAAGVAHDFNNILTIIQGHADRLVAGCAPASPQTEPLNEISAAARRASSLTRQLLTFSRKQVMQPRVLDLNTLIAHLGKLLQRLLSENIALHSRLERDLPAIEADAGMIEQVIMNLSVNARDAMPKGGQLTLGTSLKRIDEARARRNPDARPGAFVCLCVTDTGSGMSPETLGRIFEPFYTTKEVGKGTGLGLATVYGIVKQHQGWVEVESELNVGTTFHVYLPACDKKAEAASLDSDASPSAVRGGSETILLVEDEPVLRELARVILQDLKYRVIEAGSGVEAVKVFQAHEGRVDLLLTDLVMPEGMTGRELADHLKVRSPGLKVIFTSGYSADVLGNEPLRDGTLFLQKPYAPPLLARTVRQCLDAKP
jgi:PAS domain S-box-containing protein